MGHYRLLRREDGGLWELGRGSMGVTYKAVDIHLDKPVALKVVNAHFLTSESSRERFQREARGAASLDHRHVARVCYFGQSGQNFFYAMEYVDGSTIETIVQRDGPMAWRAALGVALQVTRALMAAHAKGLVHRDIKPANIVLVDEMDERNVAKLIDFGLARSAAEENGSKGINNASGFLGTPLYASPEQCEELPADIRSDIYSLGVTLWFMLTGHPTFEGPLGKVFHQQLYAPPPFEKLPANLPPAVCMLLEKMLAKDRTLRQRTPTELREDIEKCLRSPTSRSVYSAGPPVIPLVASEDSRVPMLPARPLADPESTALATAAAASPARLPVATNPGHRSPVGYVLAGAVGAAVLLGGLLWTLHAPWRPAGDPAVSRAGSPEQPTPTPFQVEALLTQAREASKANVPGQIITSYNAVLAAAPNSLEALVKIAGAEQALHENEKAQTAFQRAITLPAENPRDAIYLALAYSSLGQREKAHQSLEAGSSSRRKTPRISSCEPSLLNVSDARTARCGTSTRRSGSTRRTRKRSTIGLPELRAQGIRPGHPG